MAAEERRFLVVAALPLLRQGSEGEAVQRLQALLNVAADAGLAEDGVFGPRTDAATRAFQAARHLLVDGIVGSQTWTALLSVPGRYPEVILQQPQPYDIVDDPIRISGIGRGFEGTISTRARDANGTVLAEHFVQGGAFALANFQGELSLGAIPPTPHETLEVFPSIVTDEGTPTAPVVVPIVFGRALASTYSGFHPHVVRPGETLSGIAQAFYGDPSLFWRIFEANRNLLADPDLIHPGQTLRVPFGADTTFPVGG